MAPRPEGPTQADVAVELLSEIDRLRRAMNSASVQMLDDADTIERVMMQGGGLPYLANRIDSKAISDQLAQIVGITKRLFGDEIVRRSLMGESAFKLVRELFPE